MIDGGSLHVRPAVLTDHRQIANLIQISPYVHRHLDWRSPLDWIGTSPFHVIEQQGQIIASLGCPPEPPTVAWIRLFVNSGKIPLQDAWQMLWDKARAELSRSGQFIAAAIILQDWLHKLLSSSGFNSRQSIVMLERDGGIPADMDLQAGVTLRAMMPFDLPAVAEVDTMAFDLLWQNTLPVLERAYPQALFATVTESKGQVNGYQISTRNPLGVHLARLAVRPDVQGKGLGYILVADLIRQAEKHGISHMTVNTQSDNASSLALYKRMGFHETGERYPVYQLQFPQ